ncbi:hypothetical protein N4T77_01750 [Clostridium sp. CX1]|uniref:hypothetical protein n=1 Tax=Clostridium sp. CX1 TaxID=2978346 RepID=UPI0021C01418|nr:hypothetical protein [Clostridium sp. CX1]MCT8975313.1 hypothetical protein [Clostridium sp. CX1]
MIIKLSKELIIKLSYEEKTHQEIFNIIKEKGYDGTRLSLSACMSRTGIRRNSYTIRLDYENKSKPAIINILELNSFISGMENDLVSVKNSTRTSYTNGLLEGMVSKVKRIKRTSYERCKFELLRLKVLNYQEICD